MEVMITVSSGTGRLMNWGSCIGEDAAPVDAPAVMIGSETFPAVTEPVLIEEDVVYARAGMQCIVYLKNDGASGGRADTKGTFHSGIVEQPSWARGWDAEDPFRMRAESPQKLLDDCIYVTTGITRELRSPGKVSFTPGAGILWESAALRCQEKIL